eukprot:TRINITY_DN30189_c0_g1_i1.p1 TRINITY_DN30189_c0_g1~~TRINITY_DN30189_c0_g1_i1.p1  ORF type:complete len:198 (-),score=35.65 TRINITY_DN30189_c0_g1_i1:700-1293(-)
MNAMMNTAAILPLNKIPCSEMGLKNMTFSNSRCRTASSVSGTLRSGPLRLQGRNQKRIQGATVWKSRPSVRVSASAGEAAEVATAEAPAAAGKVKEVDINTFYPALRAAGEKLVVVDLYTQWCGPCKLLAPKIDALVNEYPDVVFVKMDCNQENKALAKELGIKVVPTFKLYKQNELVGQVAGAKFDALLLEINKLR